MKIYEFKWSENTDWIIAYDLRKAKLFYKSISDIEDFSECKISVVPKKTWGECYIVDFDDQEPEDWEPEYKNYNPDEYCDGYKITGSFADYNNYIGNADIVATTAV